MKFIYALLAVLVVPLLAMGVALYPLLKELSVPELTSVTEIWMTCASSLGASCNEPELLTWLGTGAMVTAAFGLALLLIVQLVALLTSWNRALLAFSFPPLAFIALISCGVIAIAQTLLLAGGAYVLEVLLFEEVHLYIIGGVALLGMLAGIGVIFSALGMFRKAQVSVIGVPIRPIDAPHIHRVVSRICKSLKTQPPQHVVVGLDANFFATSANVITPFSKVPMTGQTLYMSLPLLRMLSDTETKSIIGHEMAHFSGSDTVYSKRFAPVYRGLEGALFKLEGKHKKTNVLSVPSKLIIGYLLETFARIERRIGRDRETRADSFGAEVGSAAALSNALMKVSVLSAIWRAEQDDMVNRVQNGRFSRNLSRNFVDRTRYDINHDKISGLAVLGMETEVPHPTDTHPTTNDRIEALGLNPDDFAEAVKVKESLMPKKTLISNADSIEAIEEQLTDAYQQIVAHLAGVRDDDASKNETAFSNVLSMCLAKMVLADGIVDDREIEVAQAEASRYDQAFDPVSFKEYCRHPDDIPSAEKLIYWGNMMLNTNGAARLREILRKIAIADGAVDPEEQALLDRFDDELIGEDRPPAKK